MGWLFLFSLTAVEPLVAPPDAIPQALRPGCDKYVHALIHPAARRRRNVRSGHGPPENTENTGHQEWNGMRTR
ncbi:uncharacterized protein BT62DRAFT_936134 [Guyanagaster necrorhizus]|uniref:Secreted protein n=1 Tax=Guyanagaster necrorhizus TaxID=856835 RepID=A0A9P8ANU7_9AGAR|nr:uncharacterized protein BT62DRAFT_936134 [Guyanagaster necrorhizus MCA 3950]KAG7442295.1 hypothetical protein BT62DRAFT_936134 [Guyanagaster necrorhizus MCA 3950]